jgi:hypothetical protein
MIYSSTTFFSPSLDIAFKADSKYNVKFREKSYTLFLLVNMTKTRIVYSFITFTFYANSLSSYFIVEYNASIILFDPLLPLLTEFIYL